MEVIKKVKKHIEDTIKEEVVISSITPAVTGCRVILIYKGHDGVHYRLNMKLICEGFTDQHIERIAEIEDKIDQLLPTNSDEYEITELVQEKNFTYYIIKNEDPADTGKNENTDRFERDYKLRIKRR